jgi:hypothetical protein
MAVPVATCHQRNWFSCDRNIPVAPIIPERQWFARTRLGEIVHPDSSAVRTMANRLEYFQFMFPPAQLIQLVELTNIELPNDEPATTPGEMMKFLGIILLMTRLEVTDRRKLWSSTSIQKYIPAPEFGKTGMTRHRTLQTQMLRECNWRFPNQRPLKSTIKPVDPLTHTIANVKMILTLRRQSGHILGTSAPI